MKITARSSLSRAQRSEVLLRDFGRYEPLFVIASGGMADVIAARAHGEERFVRVVAIKRIRDELRRDSDLVDAFLDEARVTAALSDSRIAAVLDVGRDDLGVPFLVMELIVGVSLGVLMRCVGPLPHAVIAHIAADVAAGLHAAHQALDPRGAPLGVVHRDVSPQNILVGLDGHARIVDFGIARARGRCAEPTAAGILKGKFNYVAPEQLRGQATVQTDIFSLGVCMWEACTGRSLFHRGDMSETLRAVCDDPIARLDELDPSCPKPLADLVAHMLRRPMDERPADALVVANALDALRSSLETSAPVLGRIAEMVRVPAWPLVQKLRAEGAVLGGAPARPFPAGGRLTRPSRDMERKESERVPRGTSRHASVPPAPKSPVMAVAHTSSPGTSSPGTSSPDTSSPASSSPSAKRSASRTTGGSVTVQSDASERLLERLANQLALEDTCLQESTEPTAWLPPRGGEAEDEIDTSPRRAPSRAPSIPAPRREFPEGRVFDSNASEAEVRTTIHIGRAELVPAAHPLLLPIEPPVAPPAAPNWGDQTVPPLPRSASMPPASMPPTSLVLPSLPPEAWAPAGHLPPLPQPMRPLVLHDSPFGAPPAPAPPAPQTHAQRALAFAMQITPLQRVAIALAACVVAIMLGSSLNSGPPRPTGVQVVVHEGAAASPPAPIVSARQLATVDVGSALSRTPAPTPSPSRAAARSVPSASERARRRPARRAHVERDAELSSSPEQQSTPSPTPVAAAASRAPGPRQLGGFRSLDAFDGVSSAGVDAPNGEPVE